MANSKTILIVGTFDTKKDELSYLSDCIKSQNGNVLTMDVSVLGNTEFPCNISKHDVASSANYTIEKVKKSGDENSSMQIMAKGAANLTFDLYNNKKIHGVIILGGTMGTDLGLEVCQSLPMGVPKYIVSTVSFSPLISADRLSPDIQMILWAGGLYGLNSVCKSSLSQAAGAVLGAAEAAEMPSKNRPVIGMTSLGSSCLSYMKTLKPALEARGFEVAIFHATGMGGMAFERIAHNGDFACVMDFALCEISNLLAGSVVNAGENRMLSAGISKTPQIVAPGCIDLIDFAGWQEIPDQYKDRPFHEHNRLIKSSALNNEERRETAREISKRMNTSNSAVAFIMPNKGIEEWDKEGEPAHDPEGLISFLDEIRKKVKHPIEYHEINCHINDLGFSDKAIEILDEWIKKGIVKAHV